MWENMTPSTELPHDFCAGIGPLQLGVVLVFFSSQYFYTKFIFWYSKTKIMQMQIGQAAWPQ